jgi:hypothetical protein
LAWPHPPFGGFKNLVGALYPITAPKPLDFSLPNRTTLDNKKEKVLDLSRAFGLYQTLPDFVSGEVGIRSLLAVSRLR